MSREIKFRAWNIITQTMIDLRSITPLILDTDESGIFVPDETDGLFIMQYTGLKDKKGIEIYEGDIIILEIDESKEYANEPWHSIDYRDICVVEWSNTNLAYYLIPTDEEKEERQMDYYGSWSGWNWIKIIGNIHENPNLLK